MRKKKFEMDAVLKRAVLLFWRKGYAGTSMQDLVQAMGINRQSLYDTFGDKHDLFISALQEYSEMTQAEITETLTAANTLRTKLQTIFNVYVERSGTTPKGCLIVNSATELGLADSSVRQLVEGYFAKEKKTLRQVLKQYQTELMPNSDISAIADRLQNALVGIRVQARIAQQPLDAIINATLDSLPWKEGQA